jgi:hypothetical protein
MDWTELFLVFLVSHLAGDYLLQTEWQARNKAGGLGANPVARRALLAHVGTYTLAFVPALVWMADELGVGAAVAAAVAIALPHLIVDDRRLLTLYIRTVKGCPEPVPLGLLVSVDQSVHLIALWILAVVAA